MLVVPFRCAFASTLRLKVANVSRVLHPFTNRGVVCCGFYLGVQNLTLAFDVVAVFC